VGKEARRWGYADSAPTRDSGHQHPL
jgi:hypothetical protein